MIEVVIVKFKNRGKSYFFSPNGLKIDSGMKVIVETSKGLEIVDCCHGNHMVMDTSVIQPLRPVARIATADDLRIAELNKRREKEAFDICQQKIAEHKLDMHLVDVECNFEGNKTMFFFTSDGRVDFRELVKDLAGIFRNRIELRQIGVRDEAKMIGGLGICGRAFCCGSFMDEFQPVSTKMAKTQSMSLNPTKISGTCGRLMCCLRYEQEAYEELVKKVPKNGAFVETPDGYGNVTQVNILRQTVRVKLDGPGDDSVKAYEAEDVAAIPGGRPKDGSQPPHVLVLRPKKLKEPEEEDPWLAPVLFAEEPKAEGEEAPRPKKNNNNRRRNKKPQAKSGENAPNKAEGGKGENGGNKSRNSRNRKPQNNKPKGEQKTQPVKAQTAKPEGGENKPKKNYNKRRYYKKPKKDGPPKAE